MQITTVEKIKEMYAEGHSMKELKQETGLSYPTLYKYSTTQRRRQEREEEDAGLDDEEDEERATYGGDSSRIEDEDWS